MVTVRPIRQYDRYTGQSDTERADVFADLQRDPRAYLAHGDPQVRSLADWTLTYYGLRHVRPVNAADVFPANVHVCSRYLYLLVSRLRELAGGDERTTCAGCGEAECCCGLCSGCGRPVETVGEGVACFSCRASL